MQNRTGLNSIHREKSAQRQEPQLSKIYSLKHRDSEVSKLGNVASEKKSKRDVQKSFTKARNPNIASSKRGQNIIVGRKRLKLDRNYIPKPVDRQSARNIRDCRDSKQEHIGNKILNSEFLKCKKKEEDLSFLEDELPGASLLRKRRSYKDDFELNEFESKQNLIIKVYMNLEDGNIFEDFEVYKAK